MKINKLIIVILIELDIIKDKSYLFGQCKLLKDFPTMEYDVDNPIDPRKKLYDE